LRLLILIILIASIFLDTLWAQDSWKLKREKMVATQLEARGIKDQEVLRAMRKVPRERFVPEWYRSRACGDHPLPIGYGQTISQPYIVALMTELVELKERERVLEIGSGSGYQAAILAELKTEVYTIEIIKPLYERAKKILSEEGYQKVKFLHGDGYLGWKEHAPYDAIIVTCAPDHIPQPLLKQLKDNGVMVIPVGPPGAYQTLWVVKREKEKFIFHNWGEVRFVPLIRRAK